MTHIDTTADTARTLVTTSDIARMANVKLATVSNWKTRHGETFPQACGTVNGNDAYDYDQVARWLADNGKDFADDRLDRVVWGCFNALRDLTGSGSIALFLIGAVALRKAADTYGLADEWQALLDHVDPQRWRALCECVGRVDAERGEGKLAVFANACTLPPNADRQAGSIAHVLGQLQSVPLEQAPVLVEAILRQMDRGIGRHGEGEFSGYDPMEKLVSAMANAYLAAHGKHDAVLYDPACGVASTPLRIARDHASTILRLADINPTLAGIAQARLFIQDGPADPSTVKVNDLYATDPYPGCKCDVATITPPWGMRIETESIDPRWRYGTVRREDGLMAMQDALDHLNDSGIAFIACTPATTYGKAGASIRRRLVADGLVAAVVALPANTLDSTRLSPIVWILRRKNEQEGIYLINCDAPCDETDTQGLPQWIASPLMDFTDGAGFSWAKVPASEILAGEEASLIPWQWVHPGTSDREAIRKDTEHALTAAHAAIDAIDAADSALRCLPREVEQLESPSRMVTLDELVRNGEIAMLHGSVQPDGEGMQPDVIYPRDLSSHLSRLVPTRQEPGSDMITQPGDVLFIRLDVQPAVVDEQGSHRVCRRVGGLRVTSDAWLPEFIACCMTADWNSAGTRGARPIMLPVGQIQLPVVPIEVQERLAQAWQAAEQAWQLSAKTAGYAHALRNAIRYGTGE